MQLKSVNKPFSLITSQARTNSDSVEVELLKQMSKMNEELAGDEGDWPNLKPIFLPLKNFSNSDLYRRRKHSKESFNGDFHVSVSDKEKTALDDNSLYDFDYDFSYGVAKHDESYSKSDDCKRYFIVFKWYALHK